MVRQVTGSRTEPIPSLSWFSSGLARRVGCDRRGSAAVEFAVFAQILVLIFSGVIDIGLVVLKRFNLDNSLSAAANYAMVNPTKISSVEGGAMAIQLAAITSSEVSSNYADVVVTVNNGPRSTIISGVGSNDINAASRADKCYCPTGLATIVWGPAAACGSACPSGMRAGKFVSITASRLHKPLFANYGIVHNGAVRVTMIVQTE